MSMTWLPWLALLATMLLALTAAKVLRRSERGRSRPVYVRQR